MQALSINLEDLNGYEQNYFLYLSIINFITLFKMIKDNYVY